MITILMDENAGHLRLYKPGFLQQRREIVEQIAGEEVGARGVEMHPVAEISAVILHLVDLHVLEELILLLIVNFSFRMCATSL